MKKLIEHCFHYKCLENRLHFLKTEVLVREPREKEMCLEDIAAIKADMKLLKKKIKKLLAKR